MDLEAIKSRLIRAGYPRLEARPPSKQIRDTSREAQEARAELRDRVIDDIWALIDEVESLRERAKP